MKATKLAKDLQVGDVYAYAGMVRYEVTAVTPVGHTGTMVEVMAHQVGKPDNVRKVEAPALMLFEVVD